MLAIEIVLKLMPRLYLKTGRGLDMDNELLSREREIGSRAKIRQDKYNPVFNAFQGKI